MRVRHIAYKRAWLARPESPLPVIVVGNLSVGGTGKTPLVAHLVSQFQLSGWQPGIVSRGYGGAAHKAPHIVCLEDSPSQVGDEPLMLARQTAVPVCVCLDRAAAVAELANRDDVNIIISDDGLQHLAMRRNVEIVVIDAKRGLGNRWLLPAGPLRDNIVRLAEADLIVLQQASGVVPHSSLRATDVAAGMESVKQAGGEQATFCLSLVEAVNVRSGEHLGLASLAGKKVHAVAGIGNPERFFCELRRLGMKVESHPMADHHVFRAIDFNFSGSIEPGSPVLTETTDDLTPILVTTKDAVKLRGAKWLPATVYEVSTKLCANDGLNTAIDGLEKSLRKGSDAESIVRRKP